MEEEEEEEEMVEKEEGEEEEEDWSSKSELWADKMSPIKLISAFFPSVEEMVE